LKRNFIFRNCILNKVDLIASEKQANLEHFICRLKLYSRFPHDRFTRVLLTKILNKEMADREKAAPSLDWIKGLRENMCQKKKRMGFSAIFIENKFFTNVVRAFFAQKVNSGFKGECMSTNECLKDLMLLVYHLSRQPDQF
jgi:hypothetical protein